MARVPQDATLDVKLSVKELNDEIREIADKLDKTKALIPSTVEVERIKGDIQRLSKTPTYLDPNDVFRGSGPAHMHGYVPDPGPTPGTSKFLREDGEWASSGSGGGLTGVHGDLSGRSDANQHPASAVANTPAGYIAATDVQAALNELDGEKLARSGAQDMQGDLDMGGHEIGDVKNITFTGPVGAAIIDQVRTIYMTGDGEITGAKLLDMSVSGVGEGLIDEVRTIDMNGVGLIKDVKEIDFNAIVVEGIINLPRVIHMSGDDTDSEARIDGLERVIFNDEPTKSVIQNPSVVKFNATVDSDANTTPALGQLSYDTVEKTLVSYVQADGCAGPLSVDVTWTCNEGISHIFDVLSVTVTNGSGNYTYDWSLADYQGTFTSFVELPSWDYNPAPHNGILCSATLTLNLHDVTNGTDAVYTSSVDCWCS